MRILRFLIQSNIYISVAAVALTVATQIQIGINPQWHPYLFLIFFSTLFEYNLHRFITILTTPEALNSPKHSWVKANRKGFNILVTVSIIGFIFSVMEAKLEVLLSLAPIALLTLFYSTPITTKAKGIFRLRQFPYLKIFIIAFVWSSVTVILPVIHTNIKLNTLPVLTIIVERFLFILAITIPFDIRDMEADSLSGVKTIPLKLGVKSAQYVAWLSLTLFVIIALVHYSITKQHFILLAFILSYLSTLYFLISKKIQSIPLYYYGILDGTMLLQGILVLCFYLINEFIQTL